MAELKIYLSDELDKRFRKTAMSTYGYGKGSLSKAATEAFVEWSRKHETTPEPAPEHTTGTTDANEKKPAPSPRDKD